jgi:hypothetical protein
VKIGSSAFTATETRNISRKDAKVKEYDSELRVLANRRDYSPF